MQRYDDPQTSSSLFVGTVGLLLVVIVVLLAKGFFFRMLDDEVARKNLPGLGEEARFLSEGQLAQLSGYRPVEGEEGRVAIPIERAMEIIVEEYGP